MPVRSLLGLAHQRNVKLRLGRRLLSMDMLLVLLLNCRLCKEYTISISFLDVCSSINNLRKPISLVCLNISMILLKPLITYQKLKRKWIFGKSRVSTLSKRLKKLEIIFGKLVLGLIKYQDTCQEILTGQNGINSFLYDL